jgi:hypothetical protein
LDEEEQRQPLLVGEIELRARHVIFLRRVREMLSWTLRRLVCWASTWRANVLLSNSDTCPHVRLGL